MRVRPPERPARQMGVSRSEVRIVVRLEGGRVVDREAPQEWFYRECWLDGSCRHVVLDVATRGRVAVKCPDCQEAQP